MTEKHMMTDDHLYGFTINPAVQCYDAPNDQSFILAYSHFIFDLCSYREILPKVELYPEFSPSRACSGKRSSILPRLHFHGAVTVDPFRYYTYGCQKLLKHSIFAFNETPDYEYCTKNRSTMESLFLKQYGLPYKLTYDIFDNKPLMKKLAQWRKRSIDFATIREQLEFGLE